LHSTTINHIKPMHCALQGLHDVVHNIPPSST
jgi:hypothetical protein